MENIERSRGKAGETTPGTSPSVGVRDSAEQSRTNLREIYGDVLGVADAATATTDVEIGFHFYEGMAKLVRKMQGAMGRPLHQLWAAAEELRFLFDAHAIWISVPTDRRQVPRGIAPEEMIWEVATLTRGEKDLLGTVLDGLPPPDMSGIRCHSLEHPLGERQGGFARNSNLASVDMVLVIDVPEGTGTPWRLAAFMEHSPGRATRRESTRFCEAILPVGAESQRANALRRALARLALPFGRVGPLDMDHLDFWDVKRRPFQEESAHLQKDQFCELYRQRYLPIHTILERIYGQMDTLLEGERAETTLIFSYRSPEDDFISFFPTAHQADLFVQSEGVQEFLDLWQFQYPRSKAISGWVLATGTCDYTENFDADGRWTDWIRSSRDQGEIKRQLARVLKLFKTERGSEPKFMYLVPILLRPGRDADGTKPGSPQLQPILMASIASTKPMGRPLRRQLYDLAWQTAPAVEMALLAQMTQEKSRESELRAKDAEVKAAQADLKQKEADRLLSLSQWLGHTLPKFIFKPLEFYTQKMHGDLQRPQDLLNDYKALSFFNSKGQTEFRWFVDFIIPPTQDPNGVPKGSCLVRDVIADVQQIDALSRDLAVAGRLDRWDVRSHDKKSLREVARSQITLDVETLRDCPVAILGAKESHVIALWNLVDNALDSFDWSLLYSSPETRFTVKVEGAVVGDLFKLSISNNGREMEVDIAEMLSALLAAAHSDTPDVVSINGIQKTADIVRQELKVRLNKENPCQGLYRTARFLHDLSPAHTGEIKFARVNQFTVIDLFIPKRP